jgi:hypothetical protein
LGFALTNEGARVVNLGAASVGVKVPATWLLQPINAKAVLILFDDREQPVLKLFAGIAT